MEVDKYTKEQATEYANNDAEMQGYPVGGPQWKACFKGYIEFAKTTMSVGRNPRSLRNPSKAMQEFYPDILSSTGLAGRLARNYRGKDGKGVPLDAIQNRIMSSVTNLVKLFENAELGTKTTTDGSGQGLIENDKMSELQLPSKPKSMSDDEYNKLAREVIRKQMTRDMLTNMLLESLIPFFELKKSDIDTIMNNFNWKVATVQDFQKSGLRKSWIDALRGVIGKKMSSINYRKIILGN